MCDVTVAADSWSALPPVTPVASAVAPRHAGMWSAVPKRRRRVTIGGSTSLLSLPPSSLVLRPSPAQGLGLAFYGASIIGAPAFRETLVLGLLDFHRPLEPRQQQPGGPSTSGQGCRDHREELLRPLGLALPASTDFPFYNFSTP